jgi:DNA polymerase-3 subunit epsilon
MQDQKDTPLSSAALEAAASLLGASNDFTVLRRFAALPQAPLPLPCGYGVGLVLDTETTGKTPADAIVELGLVTFAFSPETGEVLGLVDSYCGLEDPGRPIPPEASKVNGITDEMVAGKTLDTEKILSMLASASLVIAHNANFDRPKVEARLPAFVQAPWACSMSQVPWAAAGIETQKLKFIATELGYFYEAHRADADCIATLQVLNQPLLEMDGKTGLNLLLAAARTPTLRLWAVNSPFAAKDVLKAREYRWSGGDTPGWEKAWYKDFESEGVLNEELQVLRKEIYRSRCSVLVSKLDAYTRFSSELPTPERVYVD